MGKTRANVSPEGAVVWGCILFAAAVAPWFGAGTIAITHHIQGRAFHAVGGKKTAFSKVFQRLPLYFVANKGQMNPAVLFYESGPGHTTFFTREGIVLGLEKLGGQNGGGDHGRENLTSPRGKSFAEKLGRPHVSYLFIAMPGMNKNVKIEAQGVQKGKLNYFLGNDPNKWNTDIPTYKAVIYRNVYPGIDIRFYGNNRGLEYDIIVKPGADPSAVRFRYSGARDVRVGRKGNLCIDVAGGRLIEQKPTVYQRVCGQKVLRRGVFVVRKDPKVLRSTAGLAGVFAGHRSYVCGFHLGHYDRKAPLIVDPSLVYSTYLGGSGQYGDCANAIVSDPSGNAYVTGFTSSVDFPTTSGVFQTTLKSTQWNVFVTKIASDGASLVYSTFLGGSGFDCAKAIAIDSSENVYVTGYTASTDFPTSSTAFQKKLNSTYENAFVTEISADGTALVYSTYLGGNGGDSANGIVVSSSGNAYVTGFTSSTDFPCTLGAFQNQLKSWEGNAFVTEVAAGGSGLVYSTYLGGTVFDCASSIAIDGSGNAYVTGDTYSADFPVTPGCFQGKFKSTQGNAFVTEIAPGGVGLVYSTFLGGSCCDNGSSIAVDNSGNAYITGQTSSIDFPVTPGCFQGKIKSTQGNAFVTEIAPGGAGLVYSTYLGGSAADGAEGIAIDLFGNVFVTGWTRSNDFPLTCDAGQTSLKSSYENGFVSEIGEGGSNLIYSTYLGGGGSDTGQGISIDSSGNGYVAGYTNSTDFPVTGAAVQTSCKSNSGNCFVAKINLLINGACGSSNGVYFHTAPSTNLCGSGTASAVSGAGPWNWTCNGQYGGTTASCSANIIIDGACGSSSGGSFSTAPQLNLCGGGTASAVSGTGPWNWTCTGENGGTTASCSANPSSTVSLWQNAVDLGNGWKWCWFGFFNTSHSPWIYHAQLGWLYTTGTSADNIWFYYPAMNSFLWTNMAIYPAMYRASDGAWLYYDEGSSNPIMFYNFKSKQWENN